MKLSGQPRSATQATIANQQIDLEQDQWLISNGRYRGPRTHRSHSRHTIELSADLDELSIEDIEQLQFALTQEMETIGVMTSADHAKAKLGLHLQGVRPGHAWNAYRLQDQWEGMENDVVSFAAEYDYADLSVVSEDTLKLMIEAMYAKHSIFNRPAVTNGVQNGTADHSRSQIVSATY